ncbi:MAG TPA: hypothetical protein VFL03_11475 [Candidatus Limnocylindrales bacterium]|nr:hypothetical protein [Candidatus Limnocylindrales bacterium]
MTTPLRRPGRLAALLVALLVAACGPQTTTPSPSASPSPAVSAPAPSAEGSSTPDAGASPSAEAGAGCDPDQAAASPESPAPDASDPNAAMYGEIEQEVSQLRGITATKPVERGVFDKPGLCAYITASFAKDNPAELVAGTEALYKALNLMPQDASLHDLYIELLTSQVAGLYDDETKKMYVVSSTGEIGPAEKITYAHEYTHALQDQKFTLRDVQGDAKDQGDRTLARTTLIEGDATLLMSLWAQQHLTAAELGQVANSIDPASEAVLAKMPAILKDALIFPYTSGLTMNLGAFQQGGGYGGVDQLYANPPDTTEQVIHADKLAAREPAVKVDFPDDFPGSLGDGWKIDLQDTLGEFQLKTLLADAAQAADADDAAAGWGGDRVAYVTGPDGANAAVLDTRWDTDADASAFAAALSDYVAKLEGIGRSAAVLTPAPDRVVVISANDADTLGKIGNVLGLAG